MDSPVTIELVDGAAALDHLAVDRDLLARAHAEAVADMHGIERDLLVAAVGADAPRGLRREIEERADGAAGALAGPQLQHLAEQHQHGDHGRGLEVDRRPRRRGRARQPGTGRAQGRDDAVELGRAGAHARSG